MHKYDFKDFKTLDEQINLLKTRKLNFHNEILAKETLLKRNYFDIINGFETLTLVNPKSPPKEYLNGTYFEHLVELYDFDRSLSSIILKAIDSFESRLKSSLAYRFCEDMYNSNPEASPSDYISLLKYENPYSIHNRIQALPKGTITEAFVKKVNEEIKRHVNQEIGIIEYRVNQLPATVQYISSKTKIETSINKTNCLLTQVIAAITAINTDIGATPAVRKTSNRIIPIKVFRIHSLHTILTQTDSNSSNPHVVREEIESVDQKIREIIAKLEHLYARIASNNNTVFNNVAHKEIEKFINHKLFITEYGRQNNLNYIDYTKQLYGYLQTYRVPPFWVIVKTFELGFTLNLLYGLKSQVLDKIIIDMGLPPSEKISFLNSVQIIKDLRNTCAHFNLINRFRTSKILKIDAQLISKLNLQTKSSGKTHYEIRLYDTLKVLKQFEDLKEISVFFNDYHISSKRQVSDLLFENLLERMGNKRIIDWSIF